MTRVVHYREKECKKCGLTFIPRSATHVWCDSCLTKTCEQCGAEFHIGKKTKFETTRFCSRECKGLYRSQHYVGENGVNFKNGNRVRMFEFTCNQCGKVFCKEGSQVGKWGKAFCNNECKKLYFRAHSETWKGENSPRWKGGVFVAERTRFMQSPQYREWRKLVFKRDGYLCRLCREPSSGRLNAHHIISYKSAPELRLDLSNGITLCRDCHKKVHKGELDIQSDPC